MIDNKRKEAAKDLPPGTTMEEPQDESTLEDPSVYLYTRCSLTYEHALWFLEKIDCEACNSELGDTHKSVAKAESYDFFNRACQCSKLPFHYFLSSAYQLAVLLTEC